MNFVKKMTRDQHNENCFFGFYLKTYFYAFNLKIFKKLHKLNFEWLKISYKYCVRFIVNRKDLRLTEQFSL